MKSIFAGLGIFFAFGFLVSCVDTLRGVDAADSWMFDEDSNVEMGTPPREDPRMPVDEPESNMPPEVMDPEVMDPQVTDPQTPPVSEGWRVEAIHRLADEKITSMAMVIDAAEGRHVMYVNDGWLHALSLVDGVWTDEVIARAGGRTGRQLDLVAGPDGTLHAAYWWGGYLKYAAGQIGDWLLEEVGHVATGTYPSVSVALSPIGEPHVLYRFSMLLWHSRRSDGEWSLQNRGDAGLPRNFVNSAESADMAFDGTGAVRIALQAQIASGPEKPFRGYSDTRVVTGREGVWEMDTISSIDTGSPFHQEYGLPSQVSQAIDSADLAHVVYLRHRWTQDADPVALGELHYARPADGGWAVETVDADGDVGRWASLALDREGNPHVSYFAAGDGDLRYATRDGGSWRRETIDAEGLTGLYGTLALDSADRVHVVYLDRAAGTINWASRL